MSLRQIVFADCAKLLEPKYKWLTYRHQTRPYPPFKIPSDPSEDIKRALAWTDKVEEESKGTDQGDCYLAVQFRDEGTKVYRTNINVLNYNIAEKGEWFNENKPSADDVKLAVDRWSALEEACHECRDMMRALHNNN